MEKLGSGRMAAVALLAVSLGSFAPEARGDSIPEAEYLECTLGPKVLTQVRIDTEDRAVMDDGVIHVEAYVYGGSLYIESRRRDLKVYGFTGIEDFYLVGQSMHFSLHSGEDGDFHGTSGRCRLLGAEVNL